MTTIPLDLPEPLATFYFDRSRETGKTLSQLIVRDLAEWHEHQRFKANERERV